MGFGLARFLVNLFDSGLQPAVHTIMKCSEFDGYIGDFSNVEKISKSCILGFQLSLLWHERFPAEVSCKGAFLSPTLCQLLNIILFLVDCRAFTASSFAQATTGIPS